MVFWWNLIVLNTCIRCLERKSDMNIFFGEKVTTVQSYGRRVVAKDERKI